MKCTLESINAKAIAKSIQSLSKIGTELCVEADDNGLQLRTVNPSQSAIATIRFHRAFFESYKIKDSDKNCCKVSMKAILAVFKNMRQVERCEIRLLTEQLKLQVKFTCRLETMKNALIAVVDEEYISTSVSMDDTINEISGSYKIFHDVSNNFNAAEAEITIEAMGNGLTAKNYIEGARVNDKFMRSQLKLSPSEFQTYSIQQETAITFSLRELRAFLLFAETIEESVTLKFSEEGGPIFLTMNKTDYIECNLIMSTVLPDDVSFYEECRESEVNEPISNTNCKSIAPPQKRKHSNPNVGNETSLKKRLSDETTLSNNSTLFNFNTNNNHNTTLHSLEAPRNLTQQDIEMADDNEDLFLAAAIDLPFDTGNQTSISHLRQSEVFVTFHDTEEDNPEDDETIPQSPQRKHAPKLRTIFSRCFESTYIPKEPSPNSQVFVPNSDTED